MCIFIPSHKFLWIREIKYIAGISARKKFDCNGILLRFWASKSTHLCLSGLHRHLIYVGMSGERKTCSASTSPSLNFFFFFFELFLSPVKLMIGWLQKKESLETHTFYPLQKFVIEGSSYVSQTSNSIESIKERNLAHNLHYI